MLKGELLEDPPERQIPVSYRHGWCQAGPQHEHLLTLLVQIKSQRYKHGGPRTLENELQQDAAVDFPAQTDCTGVGWRPV